MEQFTVCSFGFSKHGLPLLPAPDLTSHFPYSDAMSMPRCGMTLLFGHHSMEQMSRWANDHARLGGLLVQLNQWRPSFEMPSAPNNIATLDTIKDFDLIHLNKHQSSDFTHYLSELWAGFEEDDTGVRDPYLFENGVAWRPNHIIKMMQLPEFRHLKGVVYTVDVGRYGTVDVITVRLSHYLRRERPTVTDLPTMDVGGTRKNVVLMGSKKPTRRFQSVQAFIDYLAQSNN